MLEKTQLRKFKKIKKQNLRRKRIKRQQNGSAGQGPCAASLLLWAWSFRRDQLCQVVLWISHALHETCPSHTHAYTMHTHTHTVVVNKIKEKDRKEVGEMVQQIEVLTLQACWHEFDTQNTQRWAERTNSTRFSNCHVLTVAHRLKNKHHQKAEYVVSVIPPFSGTFFWVFKNRFPDKGSWEDFHWSQKGVQCKWPGADAWRRKGAHQCGMPPGNQETRTADVCY